MSEDFSQSFWGLAYSTSTGIGSYEAEHAVTTQARHRREHPRRRVPATEWAEVLPDIDEEEWPDLGARERERQRVAAEKRERQLTHLRRLCDSRKSETVQRRDIAAENATLLAEVNALREQLAEHYDRPKVVVEYRSIGAVSVRSQPVIPDPNEHPTIDGHETARILGCSYWSLLEQVKAGTCPVEPLRLGRKLMWPTAKVLAAVGLNEV